MDADRTRQLRRFLAGGAITWTGLRDSFDCRRLLRADSAVAKNGSGHWPLTDFLAYMRTKLDRDSTRAIRDTRSNVVELFHSRCAGSCTSLLAVPCNLFLRVCVCVCCRCVDIFSTGFVGIAPRVPVRDFVKPERNTSRCCEHDRPPLRGLGLGRPGPH